MRVRAVLLGLLAGGLVISGAAAGIPSRTSAGATQQQRSLHPELPDQAVVGAALRTREQLAREGDASRVGAILVAGVLALITAGWWIAVHNRSALGTSPARARARPRAPPLSPAPVSST